jgi:hypothetical protein
MVDLSKDDVEDLMSKINDIVYLLKEDPLIASFNLGSIYAWCGFQIDLFDEADEHCADEDDE